MNNGILNAVTHGPSFDIVSGFSKPEIMYLYAVWDIVRLPRTRSMNAMCVEHEPPAIVKAR